MKTGSSSTGTLASCRKFTRDMKERYQSGGLEIRNSGVMGGHRIIIEKVVNGCRVVNVVLTAGSAKKEIPKRAQKDAIIFPGHVLGTVSP